MPPDLPGLAVHVGADRDTLERASRLAATAGIAQRPFRRPAGRAHTW